MTMCSCPHPPVENVITPVFWIFPNLENWVQAQFWPILVPAHHHRPTSVVSVMPFSIIRAESKAGKNAIHICLHHQFAPQVRKCPTRFWIFHLSVKQPTDKRRRISWVEKKNSESRSQAVAAHLVPFTDPDERRKTYSEIFRFFKGEKWIT